MLKRILIGLTVIVAVIGFTACDSQEVTSAKVYIQQSNLEKAEELLLVAFEKEPMNSNIGFLLGTEIYSKKEDWKNMSKYFQASLAIDSKFKDKIDQFNNKYWVDNFNAGAKYYNALINDEAENPEKVTETAIEAFNNAIMLVPEKAEAYSVLAQVYIFSDKIAEATEAMQTAVELNPKDITSLVNLGNILYQDNKYEDAIGFLKRALDVDPQNLLAIKQIAFIYDKMGQKAEATQAYKDAIVADPENADLHYNLGVLYHQQKDYKNAAVEFELVIKFNPESIDAMYNAGLSYSALEDFKNAEKLLKLAFEKDPESIDVVKQLKLIYYNLYGFNDKRFTEMDKLAKKLK
jgi:tetratricopeptide (TPR) repeat protein